MRCEVGEISAQADGSFSLTLKPKAKYFFEPDPAPYEFPPGTYAGTLMLGQGQPPVPKFCQVRPRTPGVVCSDCSKCPLDKQQCWKSDNSGHLTVCEARDVKD